MKLYLDLYPQFVAGQEKSDLPFRLTSPIDRSFSITQNTTNKQICVFVNGQELGVDVEQTDDADYTQDALGVDRWVYSVSEGIWIVTI